jgi:cytochrome o ubiquinol oxidase subunit I
MYIVLALLMLLRGFADAIMMRARQAIAAGGAQGYLPPEHFDQIFSAHGTIMRCPRPSRRASPAA